MPSLVIFHDKCTDGFGAALAAWLQLGDAVHYLPRNHYDPIPDLKAYDTLYFLDFCWPRAVIENLLRTHDIEIIDHHKSVIQDLAGLTHPRLRLHLDTNKSGVELAWERWHPQIKLPSLFQHIRDRDLGKLSLTTEKIIAALMTYPKEFKVWHELLLQKDFQELLLEGETIFRARNQQIEEMLDKVHWAEIAGHWVPAVNATLWWNDLTQQLLKRFPEVPFVAAYFQIDSERIKWSLRSPEGGLDMGVLAQTYGGGGHAHTGGFVSDRLTINLAEARVNKQAA